MKSPIPAIAAAAVSFSLLPAAVLAMAAVCLVGCADAPNAEFQEAVQFNSTPSKAVVAVDSGNIGQTPIEAVLSKQHDVSVTFTKSGFAPTTVVVHGVEGHLTPNPVEVTLRTDLLPDKRGADPKAELATCLENLKKYVAIGTISPEDAPLAEAQIRAFYQ